MERRFGDERRSLLSADISDVKMICLAGSILGSALFIIGILMLMPIGTSSSFRATMSIAFLVTGALLVVFGTMYLRRIKDELAKVDAKDARAEWQRFVLAASMYAAISLLLTMLNIKLELALGLPLAILGMYLFWLYVQQKKWNEGV